MAKPVVVLFEGRESSFSFSRIDRARLYGRRERHHLDPTGARCRRAALTEDGAFILLPGMTAQGYFDPAGAWVPNGTLVGIAPDGTEAAPVDSTLGAPQELTPVTAQEALDLEVSSVYVLEAEEIDGDLAQRLAAGELFSLPFAFRAGFNLDTALLVGNDLGLFLLTGRPRVPEWASLDTLPPPLEDDDDDLDADLDFEMF